MSTQSTLTTIAAITVLGLSMQASAATVDEISTTVR